VCGRLPTASLITLALAAWLGNMVLAYPRNTIVTVLVALLGVHMIVKFGVHLDLVPR
jgi:hypothetical protein